MDARTRNGHSGRLRVAVRRTLTIALVFIGVIMAAACQPAPRSISSVTRGSAPSQGQFVIQCEAPVASAPNDPIVFPGRPGASHNHEFYGNTTTDAFSSAASLSGRPTGCSRDSSGGDAGDTAAYWHPTLYVNGTRLPAPKSTFYYTNRTRKHVDQAFPPGLRVIAGDHMATAPQGTDVVYWGCGNGTPISKVVSPPQCPRGTDLTLHVIFPDCWNGFSVDAPDHKSHMAYSTKSGNGSYRCPNSHPISLPTIIMRITWVGSTPAPATLTLSSGSVDTMHADFFNTWNQARLDQLVNSCVVAERDCDYHDVDALPFPT